jgi:hypothetical protein
VEKWELKLRKQLEKKYFKKVTGFRQKFLFEEIETQYLNVIEVNVREEKKRRSKVLNAENK